MVSPETPPLASVAVAVAVEVDWPSATIVGGERLKPRVVAVPEACAADGSRQQPASATSTLSRIAVRYLIWRSEQRRTTPAKCVILTRLPLIPLN